MFITLPISSQSHPFPACRDVLLSNKDFAKKIFYCLLRDQIVATRNLKDWSIQKKKQHTRLENIDVCKKHVTLRKGEKGELASKGLKDGTRNMEVLRSVCKLWNQIILQDKECHFFLIFTRAKRFMAEQLRFSRHDFPGEFCDLLSVEALGDPEGVAFTLSHFPVPDRLSEFTLLNHVKECVARNKLASAKVMANAIQTSKEKILALCEIAKIDPTVIQEAKALVSESHDRDLRWLLGEIAIVEALHNNFEDAIVLANESRHEHAYIKIAKIGAKQGPGALKKWTSHIRKPETLARAMFEVAIINGDPIEANQCLIKLKEVQRQPRNNLSFAELYLKLAKLDKTLGYTKAKEWICSLSPDIFKVELLIALAELDEKPDFTEAKQVAASAPYSRNYEDLEWDSFFGADNQYRAIALAEAKYDEEAAKATAARIADSSLQKSTLCDIGLLVSDQCDGSISGAQIAAILFGESDKHVALNLLKVARKRAPHVLNEVKAALTQISNVVERVQVSCRIAKAILEIPLDQYEMRKDNLPILYSTVQVIKTPHSHKNTIYL